MRTLLTTLALASLALASLAPVAYAGPREQAEVRAREAVYYKAYIDADLKTFQSIFSSDFSYQHPSGNTFTSEQFLDLFRSGTLVVTSAPAPQSQIRDYGDVIVTHGQSNVEASVNGQPANGVLRFVNVWRRQGGEWRLTHRNAEFLP